MKFFNFRLVSILFIALLLAACGTSEESDKEVEAETNEETEENEETENNGSDNASLGDYEIELGGQITEEDNRFIIEGESNLLPGSRLIGEVVVDEGETIYADTTELVQEDGSFYMELDHHQYGEAEIIVRFDFDSVQDDEIKRHYGDKGQNLEGPFIYKHEEYAGILKKVEAKVEYVPGHTENLVIQAPDWYDLPEDYGDPRVWIEVVDLTEDGEFFYLHGRSNLLEGSEIKVEYRYNRDTTQVKPDGSFDFKFDYEYLEDQDIVITFDPSNFQWNEIEEAYGKNGQKLVGNLVVTNKFNTDKQFVEKRIPWDGSFNTDEETSNTDSDENNIEENADDQDDSSDTNQDENNADNTDENSKEENTDADHDKE